MALESMGRRPLKCRYCQRSYKYKMSLKLHLNDAHRDKLKRRSLQNISEYTSKNPQNGHQFFPNHHPLQATQISSQSNPNLTQPLAITTTEPQGKSIKSKHWLEKNVSNHFLPNNHPLQAAQISSHSNPDFSQPLDITTIEPQKKPERPRLFSVIIQNPCVK